MNPQQAPEEPHFQTFQEFLEQHPNPSRTNREESEEDDRLFGRQLAERFLEELKVKIRR